MFLTSRDGLCRLRPADALDVPSLTRRRKASSFHLLTTTLLSRRPGGVQGTTTTRSPVSICSAIMRKTLRVHRCVSALRWGAVHSFTSVTTHLGNGTTRLTSRPPPPSMCRWLAGIIKLWLDEEWGPQPPHKLIGEVAAEHYRCGTDEPRASAHALLREQSSAHRSGRSRAQMHLQSNGVHATHRSLRITVCFAPNVPNSFSDDNEQEPPRRGRGRLGERCAGPFDAPAVG